jgi:hypothetical protein
MKKRLNSKLSPSLSAQLWVEEDDDDGTRYSVVVFFSDASSPAGSQARVALQLDRASIERFAADESVAEVVLAERLSPLSR